MLTAVKNEFKIMFLSIKYAVIKEMLNKVSFLSNIVFMMINNACFIIQWVILFSLRKSIGGYGLKEVVLLWGVSASTYGFSHFLFKKAYYLSDTINSGKLDAYLVQPKNVLITAITSDVSVSAIGDLLYGYIMLFIYGFSITRILLFTLFTISGGLILTSVSVILSSLCFWFNKSDLISDIGSDLITSFSTYPDGIFKGITRILLFTIIPVGISTYIPVKVLIKFDFKLTILVLFISIVLVILSFAIFNKGLKRYSSSNLMESRI